MEYYIDNIGDILIFNIENKDILEIRNYNDNHKLIFVINYNNNKIKGSQCLTKLIILRCLYISNKLNFIQIKKLKEKF